MKNLLHRLPITDYRLLFVLFFCTKIFATTNYVWQGSPTPTPPHSSWATAAHTIQDAVDHTPSGNTVLVTNGYYDSGLGIFGSSSNRVIITHPLKLKSVNGLENTIIAGSYNIRTLFITAGVEVEGFTVTGGYIYTSFGDTTNDYGGNVMCWGGGVVRTSLIIGGWAWLGGGNVCCYYGGEIENCEITHGYCLNDGGGICCKYGGIVRNSIIKNNLGNSGGGIYSRYGLIENCTITDNKTGNDGGGINMLRGSIIRNCLIARNYANRDGGGYYTSTDSLVQNCTICSNVANASGGGANGFAGTNINNIVYYNSPDNFTNYSSDSVFWFNCTFPEITGDNNITNEPNFIDYEDGDFRLHHDSPCFNAGTNEAWMIGMPDLSYQDRIIDGTVDIGAYEIGKLFCEFNAEPVFGIAPLTVNFHSIVSGTNVVNVYFFWDFDNDGTNDTNGLWEDVTQFVYTNAGIYSVSLTISNSASEIANNTIEGYIDVVPEPFLIIIYYLGIWIIYSRRP
ncbi:hypothetical protein KAH27_10405, partial [bacterium]|nr:hypothetical protein [bacterium]